MTPAPDLNPAPIAAAATMPGRQGHPTLLCNTAGTKPTGAASSAADRKVQQPATPASSRRIPANRPTTSRLRNSGPRAAQVRPIPRQQGLQGPAVPQPRHQGFSPAAPVPSRRSFLPPPPPPRRQGFATAPQVPSRQAFPMPPPPPRRQGFTPVSPAPFQQAFTAPAPQPFYQGFMPAVPPAYHKAFAAPAYQPCYQSFAAMAPQSPYQACAPVYPQPGYPFQATVTPCMGYAAPAPVPFRQDARFVPYQTHHLPGVAPAGAYPAPPEFRPQRPAVLPQVEDEWVFLFNGETPHEEVWPRTFGPNEPHCKGIIRALQAKEFLPLPGWWTWLPFENRWDQMPWC